MKCAIGLGLLCCLAAFEAKAGCTVAGVASPASYGPISSTLVRTAAQSTSSSNAGLTCTAGGISLLGEAYFKATITSSNSGMVGPTGDVIAYTIYASNSIAKPITRGQAFDFSSNGLLGATAPSMIPLYFTTAANNVAAGVYTETLNVRWDWSYCTGLGVLGICLGYDTGSNKISTLTVSMTVANDCTISAPSISFGSAPVVSAFSTVSQTVSVNCTKGSAYTVGLGDGTHPVSVGGRRQMMSGGNYLAYDIFQSAGTTRWGSVGAARRASSTAEVNPGNGLGSGSQIFNYNARIYTDQATPPAGTYTDSVVLDVSF
ncbi:Csu type fimbrial protein [Pseudomonas psychrophila]|uniref:Spore coat protein U (SCPU) domain-containing protein n=1 Tax=Pseudomonas psychrophila TaxID=122355 RepID=A0ABY0W3Z8_9PSED|nr:spore coat U domain-containing protein [Pseudomonas psychrophila]KAB0491015.1 spore coat U domain-containing protein [Pseudomonas psychrophila]KMM99843.1 lipoprotein [Pseudomonas psychrophila]QIE34374.1 spore coat U domain-containing protein [Pseudomonas psychrophila]WVI96475.1 spore coat U domain-containing protein [Pseudomonas psychrophila]SDU71634.1 Spore coat protein U (SCPU) domain-containing protein [Pseudomonas psychrophila]